MVELGYYIPAEVSVTLYTLDIEKGPEPKLEIKTFI